MNLRHLALAALLVATPLAGKDPTVGQPAPPIVLTLMDGSKVALADLKGQVVLINFWATWCVPCRQELPLLDDYYRKMQPNGLRVFAVTTEDSLQPFQLKKLFAAMAIPSVRHVKGMSDEMPSVPTNYVIDRAGVVRYARAGAFTIDTLNRELIPLLNERPADQARVSAATPGSARPSIHSRNAPPAVETKLKSPATPA